MKEISPFLNTKPLINKCNLSERDVVTKFILPALYKSGWDHINQIREEFSLTEGTIFVKGSKSRRGKKKQADIVLFFKPNIPLAVIEAKRNDHNIFDGIQQALNYARMLHVPFAFSSNGDGFIFHDGTVTNGGRETNLSLEQFPSPAELWSRYQCWKGFNQDTDPVVLQDYFENTGSKIPRYYQIVAVNAVTEAIAKGQNRILLVMATGTGKTYTAFQIIWRLWKVKRKKRILFLADRNVLIDQARTNDFRFFSGRMTKIKRPIDKSYEIYLGLYQAITGSEEHQKSYKELSETFFDLIVIDECHRGSAADDSAWREILEYFCSATQIGLTATPKETEYISNINYFGEPVFTYSLKQGIEDGFLAPYKVIRAHIDIDIDGYCPEKNKLDIYGQKVEDHLYTKSDFDRTLVISERTKLVANKISKFLVQSGNRHQKTIIFCVDQEHAARMRQSLINENSDLVDIDSRYVMRITGSDSEGIEQLSNFIDPESKYPTLVTTSRLLSTGVDVQTCHVIVLDRDVGSMTEFKQIIGRGTRVHEGMDKFYFTIIDFRGSTYHFSDPEFDGEPIQIYQTKGNESIVPPDTESETECDSNDEVIQPDPNHKLRKKTYVDGVEVEIVGEQIQYLNERGNLISESLRKFTRNSLRKQLGSHDNFILRWDSATQKQIIVDEIESQGFPLSEINQRLCKDLDPFDLICHIVYDARPKTRQERANNARKHNIYTKCGGQARDVLDALLDKYADEGIFNLTDVNVLKIPPFNRIGTPVELINAFGAKQDYDQAVHDLLSALYKNTS